MVELFNRARFDASSECLGLAQRFSTYLGEVVGHFEKTGDFVVLDNCFYQMLMCFLFKMEKLVGKFWTIRVCL